MRRIDCSRDDAAQAIAFLRAELGPKGNVVSPEGRERTIQAFGEPLSPSVSRNSKLPIARPIQPIRRPSHGFETTSWPTTASVIPHQNVEPEPRSGPGKGGQARGKGGQARISLDDYLAVLAQGLASAEHAAFKASLG